MREHPKRPILGFSCERSEVSGRRLWGTIAERFSTPAKFFSAHFIANYCPLVFMESTGRNRTPDKLPADERDALFEVCDAHLRRIVAILEPEWVIGVGAFARARAEAALTSDADALGRKPFLDRPTRRKLFTKEKAAPQSRSGPFGCFESRLQLS